MRREIPPHSLRLVVLEVEVNGFALAATRPEDTPGRRTSFRVPVTAGYTLPRQ